MYGISIDRYGVLSGLRYACRIARRRAKALCYDMPSLRDLHHRFNKIVLKGRHNAALGFNPVQINAIFVKTNADL